MEQLLTTKENMSMTDKRFESWIKISHYDCMYDKTSGIEISKDLYVRLFKIPTTRKEEFERLEQKKILIKKSNIIYSELIQLSDTQQLFLEEKRSEIDFNIFKDSYVNPVAYEDGTTTFEIIEDGFRKTIEKTNFDTKVTEYEILRGFISDVYSVIDREEIWMFYSGKQ